jgi:hypothetical protein
VKVTAVVKPLVIPSNPVKALRDLAKGGKRDATTR